MESLKLFVNEEEIDLKLSALLKTANYQSALKVEQGGFSTSVVRGSGYNQAGQDFSFAFWISSYTDELLSKLNAFISKFVFYPGASYRLEMIIANTTYAMQLTAPKISKENITNLKTLKINLSFSAINNFFIQKEETTLPITLVDNVPAIINIDSFVPVEFAFLANIKIAEGGQILFLKFGDFSSRFVQVKANVPAKYAGICRLSLSSERCALEDLNLTPFTLGSLPIASSSVELTILANCIVSNTALSYNKGAML